MSEFYTKGEKMNVVSRINQVHTITMYCPINDTSIQYLKKAFEIILPKYRVGENNWGGVPAIDALNAFVFTTSFFEQNIDMSKGFIGVIVSALKMFSKLKKINFEFTDDADIENTYRSISVKNSIEGTKRCIYNLEVLEINLSDLFSQDIIDLLNKVFIYNGIISNSYLERKFILDFKYDEYVSFMNMFINNNSAELNNLDQNICEYFTAFPQLVIDQKPMIRLITNYTDEVYA